MDTMEGLLIFTQESRFQLLDRNGVGHHFILGHDCAAEPEQLPPLQSRQARIKVHYHSAPDLLAHTVSRITLLEG
ncbi:hypothetical protein [Rhodopila sp.]|uniref:hypothetical protein n=1 Tax=Rhodopila sp. TaxID=2480087 RepID=UPI003D0F6093